ncbi:TRAP transporter large permease [Salibacterium qingdaonense]|uniref:C4-dicarboxylate transporter, DctM subunit n=1 Tax=Salibacterium qingdaonense TaxID=266892 RepID=A0A1I4NUH4_9BACI|nr:TRAP transporter large permease [Salibacterium qingdaonense]SFM19055.1 C4-dicarboxylate transporter, DctM subunit [Salibacterium qingdaonense]
MVIGILMGVFALLLAIGIPVAVSIGLASIAAVMFMGDLSLSVIAQRFGNGVNSFPLLAIPFFVLAGSLMNSGGIATRLIDFASCLVGFIRGGLAMVNIVASKFFGGISGSSVADAVAIGSALIPAMQKKGYDGGFAAAVTAASSTIGIIIPPSIPIIIYGVMAGESISQLFLAGAIPGVLVGLSLMLVTYLMALKNPEQFPKENLPTLKGIGISLKRASLALLMPIIVLGGIIGGVVTATEAAVIAVGYSLIVGGLVYKEIKLKDFKSILSETITGTATVMLLVATASLFGWIVAYEQIPLIIGDWIQGVSGNPIITLLIINLFLLLTGLFMDLTAALIILTPVLLPIATTLGMDPVHFGIMMIVNLAIGLVTPPVGICLFAVCNIAKITISHVSRAVVPLLAAMVIILLLVAFIPQISMYLPNLTK